MRIKISFPPNLRVLSLTVTVALVRKMAMSIMMTTKIKLYVDITQLANVSTEGLDLIAGIAIQKCVDSIEKMATIFTMGAQEVPTVNFFTQNFATIR